MTKTIYDENGIKYVIDTKNKLGEGGQGAVYRVSNNKKIAIKTLTLATSDIVREDNNDELIIMNEEIYDKFSKRIRHIMAVDAITNVPNLATPIAMLKKPFCGYVMRFMNDMENISNQMARTEENLFPRISSNTSLLKKMKVLSKLSEIIQNMNARGLVYCDFSPGNVFVSKSVDSHEVWLIDTDNLRFSGKSKNTIGTPRYRAPEIANGTQKGNTFYSDIYSFALLAYEYLTLSTPFYGSMSNVDEEDWAETDWEDSGETLDDFDAKSENGLIPYVYENKGNDPINESGIPASYVFTPKIADLFLQTFGKKGREIPQTRPLAIEWHEAFEEAINQITVCSNGHTNLGPSCAWCEKENHTKGDQNMHFVFATEDVIVADLEDEWDKLSYPNQLNLYQKRTKQITHRIDRPTVVDIPAEFLSNFNAKIDARIEIKSKELTFTMHGKGLSPSKFVWQYKEDREPKNFYIKENGVKTKIVSISFAEVNGDKE